MAAAWEPTPLAYPQLDVAPLLKPQLKKEQVCHAPADERSDAALITPDHN